MKRNNSSKRAMTSVGLLGALFLGLILVGGCGHKAADPAAGADTTDAPLPTVRIAPVTRGSLEKTLPASGTLVALRDHEATLSPPVTGTLELLTASYGATVTRGQIVARLSTRQLLGQIQQAQATLGQNTIQVQQAQANAIQQQAQTRSSILQAQASLRNAQAALSGAQATLTGNQAALHNAEQSLARQQTLFADGLVAQKDVESAQFAVRSAQAQVDAQRQVIDGQRQTVAGQLQAVAAARAAGLQDIVKRKDIQVAQQQVRNALGALGTARSQLALYTLRAPLTGRVTAVGARTGETVDPTTKLVTISDLRTLQLQIGVPGAAVSQVRPGESVFFSVEGVPGQTFHTTVQLVSTQVDPATGTVSVLALVANPGLRLKDDTTARVQIVTERRSGVLIVPRSAVLSDPETREPSVAVIGADSVVHVKPVKLGLVVGDKAEITGGLAASQNVAVSGQYGLPDGTKVHVENAAAAVSSPVKPAHDVPASSGAPSPRAAGQQAPSGVSSSGAKTGVTLPAAGTPPSAPAASAAPATSGGARPAATPVTPSSSGSGSPAPGGMQGGAAHGP